MQKQYPIIVKSSIKKTFEAITHLSKIKKWMGGNVVTKFKSLTNEDNPIGVKFYQNFGGLVNLEGEILSYIPPSELGLAINSMGLKGTIYYNLKEITEEETLLNFNLEMFDGTLKNKLLFAGLKSTFEKVISEHLKSVKKLAEES